MAEVDTGEKGAAPTQRRGRGGLAFCSDSSAHRRAHGPQWRGSVVLLPAFRVLSMQKVLVLR